MKKLILLLLCGLASAQTTTIVTGTIRDTTQQLVTSGAVSFELKPGEDTAISGVARFSPQSVSCKITAAGLIKANDSVSDCVITQNTALVPENTYYRVCISPENVKVSCFNWYAVGPSQDITTSVPTPATAPAYTFVDTLANQTVSGAKTWNGDQAYRGALDASLSTYFKLKTGTLTQRSASCTLGDLYFATDVGPGGNLYGCTALNTWTQLGGSGVAGSHSLLSATHTDTTAASGVLGDLITFGTAWARFAGNTSATRKFLTQTGNGSISAAPAWNTIAAADLGTGSGGATKFLREDLSWQTLPAGTSHNFLSGTHSDTVAASPVLGDTIYGNATPNWTKLAPNTTTTKKFLTEQGDGVNGAAPVWNTVATGDLGSGSANSSTFLRGDQTWATPGSGGYVFDNVDLTATNKSNTSAENTLVTRAISAGAMNSLNRMMYVKCSGYLSSATSATTLILKLAITGVTTLKAAKITVPANLVTAHWELEGYIVTTVTGASGSTRFSGHFAIGNEDPSTTITSVGGDYITATNTGTGASWDLTVGQTLKVSEQWGTASASNTITENFLYTAFIN